MSYTELKEQVWRANQALVQSGLVILTWGNASGVDRARGVMAIKPSGVPYAELRPEHIVLVGLEDGQVVEGKFRPSSDTPTHLCLYRAFEKVGGVAHTHSLHATSFAQARVELPCLGTTHADHFGGTVPVTRLLTAEEIAEAYEFNTGKVIVECVANRGLDPLQVAAVLVAGHAPFTWGTTPDKAVENSVVLEAAAQMALHTFQLAPQTPPLPDVLWRKHFFRKHGPGAYYGQAKPVG